jgi:hypothetical protein
LQHDAGTGSKAAWEDATRKLKNAKDAKTNLVKGSAYTYTDGATIISGHASGSIDALEKQKRDNSHKIEAENRKRKWAYAASLAQTKKMRVAKTLGVLGALAFGGLPGGLAAGTLAIQRNSKAERQAAHAIIMDAKLPENVARPH